MYFSILKVTKNIEDAIYNFQTSTGESKNNQHEVKIPSAEEETKDSKPRQAKLDTGKKYNHISNH